MLAPGGSEGTEEDRRSTGKERLRMDQRSHDTEWGRGSRPHTGARSLWQRSVRLMMKGTVVQSWRQEANTRTILHIKGVGGGAAQRPSSDSGHTTERTGLRPSVITQNSRHVPGERTLLAG